MGIFKVYNQFDIELKAAKGMYVFDASDNKYLDLYGGHAVISIGHSHPVYITNIQQQLQQIGFYSNAVTNKLQSELALKLTRLSNLEHYNLFMCNSGAEANENALKLASFTNKREKILALKNSFHGRTSAAVAATDNPNIITPLNSGHKVTFVDLNDIESAVKALETKTYAAVIVECIQGVGGLNEATTEFYQNLEHAAKLNGTLFIADEVQSGFGRTGKFFAFQHHNLQPDIISMAKGMGNGFPVGGILIAPHIKAEFGMLGTTYGGNYLACQATLAVLSVLESENLMENAVAISNIIQNEAKNIPEIIAVKGRGLMLGFEFEYPISELRKALLFNQKIFTGNAKNPNLIRVLPPLIMSKTHVHSFFKALSETLNN